MYGLKKKRELFLIISLMIRSLIYFFSECMPILAKKCPVVSATKSITTSRRSSAIFSLMMLNILNFIHNVMTHSILTPKDKMVMTHHGESQT